MSGCIVTILTPYSPVVGALPINIIGCVFCSDGFAYNVILIPLAAGALYAGFGIMFMPEWSALAMALSSVTVISLSLALKGYVPAIKKETKS